MRADAEALRGRPSQLNVYGSDIDTQAIAWCRKNLAFGEFRANGEYPPLAWPDASFDALVCISLFTHLDLEHHLAWIPEIARVLKPGGIALVTYRGLNLGHDMLVGAELNELETKGFYFGADDNWKGIFPEWYKGSFCTPDFIAHNWGPHLEVLACLPGRLNGRQDVMVLRRSAGPRAPIPVGGAGEPAASVTLARGFSRGAWERRLPSPRPVAEAGKAAHRRESPRAAPGAPETESG